MSKSFPGTVAQLNISKKDVPELQKSDLVFRDIRKYVANDRWTADTKTNEEITFYKPKRDNLLFGANGELCIRSGNGLKLLIPNQVVNEVLETYHNWSSHPGKKATLDGIKDN